MTGHQSDQINTHPKLVHYKAVKRIVHHLMVNKDQGICNLYS